MRITDFQRIVAMNTIAGIGMGLVGIFIPIYLLELGNSVFTVISWLLIHHASLLIGAFIAVYFSNKAGLVQTWYIRVCLVAVLFAGLFFLPRYPELLFPLALASGLEAAFFWIPYNVFTVRKTADESIGRSLAFMSNIGAAAHILVPGAAALLIIYLGYNVLFAVSLFFILISLIPVLPLRSEKTDFHFSVHETRRIIRENRRFIVPEILDNLGQDAQVIWTIFLFVTSFTILDIGALGVIAALAGIIVTHVTGVLIDRWDKRAIVRLGAIATTIAWLASYIVAVYYPTPALLYTVTVLRGFSLGIFASSYGAIMFNRARKNDAQFLVLREIPTVAGRIAIFVITLVLIHIDRFELTFVAVALLSLYFWFNDLDALLRRERIADIERTA